MKKKLNLQSKGGNPISHYILKRDRSDTLLLLPQSPQMLSHLLYFIFDILLFLSFHTHQATALGAILQIQLAVFVLNLQALCQLVRPQSLMESYAADRIPYT